jgi:tellurite resistance protein
MKVSQILVVSAILLATVHCGSVINRLAHLDEQVSLHDKYLGHVLKYYFNIDGMVPPNDYMASARAIKKIAAADGVLSPLEMQAFIALYRTAGATDAMLQVFENIDVDTIDLEADLKAIRGTDPVHDQISKRHVIFAATAIASADGFHDAERDLIYSAADAIGVPVEAAKGIVLGTLKENEGRDRRLKHMGNQKF